MRLSYDAVSYRYRADDADPRTHREWIAELIRRLDPGARVLDVGCGNGVPVARELVPAATFVRADATTLDLPTAAFDAVVCLYALIHIPLDEQPPLLERIAAWLAVEHEEFVPEGDGGHALFWARKPG